MKEKEIKYNIDSNIPQSEFTFAHKDESIHDTKFETRPIGWLEDSVRRFAKNKASVVAFGILIAIGLFSIIVPIVSPTSYVNPSDFPSGYKVKEFAYALPRFSSNGPKIGFWDGTKITTIGEVEYRLKSYNDSNDDFFVGDPNVIVDKFGSQLMYTYEVRQDTYAIGTRVVTLSEDEFNRLHAYEIEKGISLTTNYEENKHKSIIKPYVDYHSYIQNDLDVWLDDWFLKNSPSTSESNKETIKLDIKDRMTTFYNQNPYVYIELVPSTIRGGTLSNTQFVPKETLNDKKELVTPAADIYKKDSNNNYQYYNITTGGEYQVRVDFYDYFSFKYGFEPNYVFGANQFGEDIFSRIALGARFSLLLGISISLINFVIGLIYGAVSGYYGGKVDLIMERITDIIANVPSIIIMTIAQIQLVNNLELKAALGPGGTMILAILIAFIFNGWIGTAGTTRMQFYRFKGQEYVLASRTLGAKDRRLIFKHILPNAAGTLVTSSVLMVPGIIFSETSLAYLGIIDFSASGICSIGAMLNEGKLAGIADNPHVLLFPAAVISLLMICFNLFGNGLRDAFNTTLRGSED